LLWFEPALDAKTAKRRRKLESRAVRLLKHPSSDAHAIELFDFPIIDAGFLKNQAAGAGRTPATNVVGFEERNLDARGREGVRRGTRRKPAADDCDIDAQITAVAGIGGQP
jgi:hypothetical protein